MSNLHNPPIMYMLVFLSSYIFIGLKSLQQLHVVKKQYAWIVPTSMAMAFVEVYVVATTAKNGWEWLLVFLIGLGSGLGSLSATYFHSRIFKEPT
jgi:hypothetical protein